jgi:type I restriction-modification system DNA methylase subunit
MEMTISSDPRSLAGRPKDRARLLGQVLTPPQIAQHMAKVLLGNRPQGPISIVDPAVGPGTFPVALFESGFMQSSDQLTVYDIDETMISTTEAYLRSHLIRFRSFCADFLETRSEIHYDMAVLNPPYVRQEWIDKKEHYRSLFKERYGVDVPGTSNLYVYFLIKMLFELKPGGRSACIIYDSWRYTRFGNW